MFWILAALIATLTGLAIAGPFIVESSKTRTWGIVLLLLFPLFTFMLYQQVGTLDGINVSGTPDREQHATSNSSDEQINGLVGQLEQRLMQSPDDFQGWMLLGRTYKTMQQYGSAEALAIVELAEAMMFTSGSPIISMEVKSLLEKALSLDPDQQKSLWLLGFAASQSGDDARAIQLWERLLGQMDEASGAGEGVREQLNLARKRMGVETEQAGMARPAG
jgi:cytochrome c-type biogenesis protein CcmH